MQNQLNVNVDIKVKPDAIKGLLGQVSLIGKLVDNLDDKAEKRQAIKRLLYELGMAIRNSMATIPVPEAKAATLPQGVWTIAKIRESITNYQTTLNDSRTFNYLDRLKADLAYHEPNAHATGQPGPILPTTDCEFAKLGKLDEMPFIGHPMARCHPLPQVEPEDRPAMIPDPRIYPEEYLAKAREIIKECETINPFDFGKSKFTQTVIGSPEVSETSEALQGFEISVALAEPFTKDGPSDLGPVATHVFQLDAQAIPETFNVGITLPIENGVLDSWNDSPIPQGIEVIHRNREIVIRLIDGPF